MAHSQRSRKEKGFVILAGGILLLIMIPLSGLAVDAAFLYAIKTRLSAAVDAAALVAARNLSVGMTMAEQEATALTRAQAFFYANYTAESWNTRNRSLNIGVHEDMYRTRTIRITAAVDAPLYFMRLLWPSPYTVVTASGVASRRDVNIVLVIDRSGSMNNNGGCAGVRSAATAFVDMFANDRDRLGLITYGVAYGLSYAPSKQFKSSSPTLATVISSIRCAGGTGSAQALFKGYEQLANINEPGTLNVILYFTDGIPNTVTANYPVNVLDTTRIADGRNQPNPVANSRCYDYQNGQRWINSTGTGQNPAWNPTTQVYRGAVFSEENTAGSVNVFGVEGYTTNTFDDPGVINLPYANASAGGPYAAAGFEQDCWFLGGRGNGGGGGHDRREVQYDVAYYPERDLYGTSLRSSDAFRPIVSFPGGHPYAGRIDVRDTANLNNVAVVALDNVGKRIRAADLNGSLSTVVFAIGLGDVGADQHTLLRRVANDPLSPIYDSTRPQGLYLFAPTAADLSTAFVRIASEVLRVSE